MPLRERFKSLKRKFRLVLGNNPVQPNQPLSNVPQPTRRPAGMESVSSAKLPSAGPAPSNQPPPSTRPAPSTRLPQSNRVSHNNRPSPSDRPPRGSRASPSARNPQSNRPPQNSKYPPSNRLPRTTKIPQSNRPPQSGQLPPSAQSSSSASRPPPGTRFPFDASPPTHNSFRPSVDFELTPDIQSRYLGFLVAPRQLASEPQTQSPLSPALKSTWTGLERCWQALKKASESGLFGPLKLVIDDLTRCIAMHEDAAAARRDYAELRKELEALFTALSNHVEPGVHLPMTASIDNLCCAIGKELDRISTKETGTGRRHWEAKKDLNEVMVVYRRIRGHLDRLTLNADLNIWRTVNEHAAENRLKSLMPSLSAYYNSAEAALVRRRECTPNTREQVLADLKNWRHDEKQGNIFWLNGMAGTGKTTIASSLCRTLEETHELGASFFCTRQLPECRSVNRILPTIAYQLARYSRPFRCALSRALERDPDVHAKALQNQLEGLIIAPLHEVFRAIPANLVVVVDALDECEDHDRVGEILKLLVKHASALPIKVFVSSRPEPQIRQWSRSMKNQLVLHELGETVVKGDIETYLRFELAGVSVSESQLADLVQRAGVLFIYAATVVRYITGIDFHLGQQERLNNVLSSLPIASADHNEDIDALYGVILASAFSNPRMRDSDKDRMRLVLHTVVCTQEPLTVGALAGLLQLGDDGWVRHALKLLWSVLHVSEAEVDSLVTTLHASFPDYMSDSRRSKEHCCNNTSHHGRVAELCLMRIQHHKPQFNICKLNSSYVLDDQIPSLEVRVRRAIPMDLSYACQYWAALELGPRFFAGFRHPHAGI